MWTSTINLDPKRVIWTRLLGVFYPDIYYSSLSPLQVLNLPRQSLPSARWVRVRNRLAGICGSDLHLVHADGDIRVAPAALPAQQEHYLGHEVVGEIIEIGEEVQHLKVGDRVALQYGPNCVAAGVQSLCRSCTAGHYNLCEHGSFSGKQQVGGGWSEEMLLHEQQLFVVPPTLSDEQAVLLEPTAVALHAILRQLPAPGDRVLIIGAGTIGLLTLQLLQALVPQVEVSVLARHPFQVEQATRLGAKHIIYPRDTYSNVQRVTGGQVYRGLFGNRVLLNGYDVIYDTVGSRNTIHHALRWGRPRSTLVLIGVNLHLMHLDLSPLWHREINLVGSTAHGLEYWPARSEQEGQTATQQSTFAIVADLLQQGKIHPELLITHRYALTQYKDALTIASGKARSQAIKVVFDYSLLPASVVPNVRASGRLQRPLLPENNSTAAAFKPITRPLKTVDIKSTSVPVTEIPGRQASFSEVPETPAWQYVPSQNEEENEATQATAAMSPVQKRRYTTTTGLPARSLADKGRLPQPFMRSTTPVSSPTPPLVSPEEAPFWEESQQDDEAGADETQKFARIDLSPVPTTASLSTEPSSAPTLTPINDAADQADEPGVQSVEAVSSEFVPEPKVGLSDDELPDLLTKVPVEEDVDDELPELLTTAPVKEDAADLPWLQRGQLEGDFEAQDDGQDRDKEEPVYESQVVKTESGELDPQKRPDLEAEVAGDFSDGEVSEKLHEQYRTQPEQSPEADLEASVQSSGSDIVSRSTLGLPSIPVVAESDTDILARSSLDISDLDPAQALPTSDSQITLPVDESGLSESNDNTAMVLAALSGEEASAAEETAAMPVASAESLAFASQDTEPEASVLKPASGLEEKEDGNVSVETFSDSKTKGELETLQSIDVPVGDEESKENTTSQPATRLNNSQRKRKGRSNKTGR